MLDRYQLRFGAIGSQPAESLRLASVEYTASHLGGGSAKITFPITQAVDSAGASLVTRENFRPRRTYVWLERDKVVVWSGLLWSRATAPADGLITATAKGPHSYFRHRYFNTDKTFAAVDELTMAREIIDHAQAVTSGTIGILTSDTNTAGVTRTRTYLGRERKSYAEAIDQLAALTDGFDFRYDSFRDPTSGNYEVEFRTAYPATGRATTLVFEHGSNCDVIDIDEDGEAAANQVTATGAGETTAMLTSVTQDLAVLSFEPLLESVISLVDVTVQATLDAHASAELARRLDDETTVTIRMHPGAAPGIGSYLTGDRVRLIYSDAFESLDRTMRVLERKVTVIAGGEEVTVTLGPLDPVIAPDIDRLERETARRIATLERARRATV